MLYKAEISLQLKPSNKMSAVTLVAWQTRTCSHHADYNIVRLQESLIVALVPCLRTVSHEMCQALGHSVIIKTLTSDHT